MADLQMSEDIRTHAIPCQYFCWEELSEPPSWPGTPTCSSLCMDGTVERLATALIVYEVQETVNLG